MLVISKVSFIVRARLEIIFLCWSFNHIILITGCKILILLMYILCNVKFIRTILNGI